MEQLARDSAISSSTPESKEFGSEGAESGSIIGDLCPKTAAIKISDYVLPDLNCERGKESSIPLGMINPNTCICQPPWINKHCLVTHIPDNVPSSDRHDDGLTQMEEEEGRSGGILVSKLEENESGLSESDDKSDNAAWPIKVPTPFYIPAFPFYTPPTWKSDAPTLVYPCNNFTTYNPCSVTYHPFEEGKRDIVVPFSFIHGPLMNPSEYKES